MPPNSSTLHYSSASNLTNKIPITINSNDHYATPSLHSDSLKLQGSNSEISHITALIHVFEEAVRRASRSQKFDVIVPLPAVEAAQSCKLVRSLTQSSRSTKLSTHQPMIHSTSLTIKQSASQTSLDIVDSYALEDDFRKTRSLEILLKRVNSVNQFTEQGKTAPSKELLNLKAVDDDSSTRIAEDFSMEKKNASPPPLPLILQSMKPSAATVTLFLQRRQHSDAIVWRKTSKSVEILRQQSSDGATSSKRRIDAGERQGEFLPPSPPLLNHSKPTSVHSVVTQQPPLLLLSTDTSLEVEAERVQSVTSSPHTRTEPLPTPPNPQLVDSTTATLKNDPAVTENTQLKPPPHSYFSTFFKSNQRQQPAQSPSNISVARLVPLNVIKTESLPNLLNLKAATLAPRWFDGLKGGNDILAAMTKQQKQRQEVMFELLISEKDYIRDLKWMIEVWRLHLLTIHRFT